LRTGSTSIIPRLCFFPLPRIGTITYESHHDHHSHYRARRALRHGTASASQNVWSSSSLSLGDSICGVGYSPFRSPTPIFLHGQLGRYCSTISTSRTKAIAKVASCLHLAQLIPPPRGMPDTSALLVLFSAPRITDVRLDSLQMLDYRAL
jgi:hypothetical protein